jgi:hypothetical protein
VSNKKNAKYIAGELLKHKKWIEARLLEWHAHFVDLKRLLGRSRGHNVDCERVPCAVDPPQVAKVLKPGPTSVRITGIGGGGAGWQGGGARRCHAVFFFFFFFFLFVFFFFFFFFFFFCATRRDSFLSEHSPNI